MKEMMMFVYLCCISIFQATPTGAGSMLRSQCCFGSEGSGVHQMPSIFMEKPRIACPWCCGERTCQMFG